MLQEHRYLRVTGEERQYSLVEEGKEGGHGCYEFHSLLRLLEPGGREGGRERGRERVREEEREGEREGGREGGRKRGRREGEREGGRK